MHICGVASMPKRSTQKHLDTYEIAIRCVSRAFPGTRVPEQTLFLLSGETGRKETRRRHRERRRRRNASYNRFNQYNYRSLEQRCCRVSASAVQLSVYTKCFFRLLITFEERTGGSWS